MSVSAVATSPAIYVPLRLTRQSLALKTLAVLLATAFLAACSWISVPMVPVPMTMQTFGVTVVAALFGWRLGMLAVLAWLVEAAAGLPVLTAGHSGPAYMMGPTAGYLVAFVVVAIVVGWCAERGLTARSIVVSVVVMAAANLLILAIGAAWLVTFVGLNKAIPLGVTPFLIGGLLKSALASSCIEAARRHLPFH